MARVLVTNNGPHSPESWAMATAEELIRVDAPGMQGRQLMEGRILQVKVAEALSPHHAGVHSREQDALTSNAPQRFNAANDAHQHADDAFKALLDAVKNSPWESHFSKPEVGDAAKSVILSHMNEVQNVARQWHADRNPSDAARQFKQKLHG